MSQQAVANSTPQVKKFEFDDAFQTIIASLVVRDTKFVQRVDGLVRPEHFENGVEAAWVSMALRYFEKYKRVPADQVVYARLLKEDLDAKIIDASFLQLMNAHYRNVMMKADLSNKDFVVDQVAEFARHQAMAAAIVDSVPMLDRRDFEAIHRVLRRALDVGVNHDGDVYDYEEMIDVRTGERLDRAAGKLPPSGITTGHRAINDALYHKGWGRRELSVIMGGAKAGKTTALIDFGIQAVKGGHNVLYVTLEVAAKIIAERLDANISDTPVMDLENHIHDVRDKVRTLMTSAGKKFVIKEFPTGSMTVSDLRRLLERYKARGIIFDMVVLDYADLVAPARITDSSTENSKSVYVDLRGLAMSEDIAILTATQTNRAGSTKAVAKAEDVAEDFNRIRIADIVISINMTDEERANGQARLYFAASRNQAGHYTIRIEQKRDCMKFVHKVVGYE